MGKPNDRCRCHVVKCERYFGNVTRLQNATAKNMSVGITVCINCVTQEVNMQTVRVNDTYIVEAGVRVVSEGRVFCVANESLTLGSWEDNDTATGGIVGAKEDTPIPSIKSWFATGGSWHVNQDDRHGARSLVLYDNSVSQNITLKKGQQYEVTFVAAVEAAKLGSKQMGLLNVSGVMEQSFVVRKTFADDSAEPWMEFVYHFVATSTVHTLTLHGMAAHAGGMRILVDAIRVRSCKFTDTFSANNTHTPTLLLATQNVTSARITVHLNPRDAVSGIDQVFWAIGTTQGGTQLQPFRPAGRALVVKSDSSVKLEHGVVAFVTVTVKNRAGLTSLRHSGPIQVDHTSPTGVLFDGAGKNDVDGFSSTVVSANLQFIVDAESGVASCSWAVGTAPHSSNLFAWSVATASAVVSTVKPLAGAQDGMLAYVSARCVNNVGLAAAFSSNGAYFELSAPSKRGAVIEVISPPSKHTAPFPSMNGHQTVADRVHFRWDAFTEDTRQIDHYEARVIGPGVSTPWENTKLRQQIEVFNITLKENVLYKAQVVLTNAAGKKTDPVEAGVWVDSTPPKVTGVRMCADWTAKGLHVGWPDSFAEDGRVEAKAGTKEAGGCLRYHYNVGTSQGAADVKKWQTNVIHAHATEAVIPVALLLKTPKDTNNRAIVDKSVNYQVTIAAYNLAGLSTTQTFELRGAPTCPGN